MKIKRSFVRLIALVMVMVSMVLLGTGCSSQEETPEIRQYESLSDFNGGHMGALIGGAYEQMLADDFQDLNWSYYDDASTILTALKKGDIDTYVTDTPMALMEQAHFPNELAIYPDTLNACDFGMILQKDSPLLEPVNEVIRGLQKDGTIQALMSKWFCGNEDKMQIDWNKYNTEPRPNGTLRFYFDASAMPMIYMGGDGKPAGLEAELALIIADRLDMGLEMHNAVLPAVMMYVQSGKADLGAACFIITEERKESVDFCESYYSGGTAILCRKENLKNILARKAAELDLRKPGTVIATEVGTLTELAAKATYPDAEFIIVPDATNGYLAVSGKKAAALATDKITYERYVANGGKGLMIYKDGVIGEKGKIAVGISRNAGIPDAAKKMDAFINELEKEGILEDMRRRWLIQSDYTMPDIAKPDNPEYTIHIGTTGLLEPYTFYGDDGLTGMDMELMQRFALWSNAEIEVSVYDWGGLVTACTSGKVDYAMSNLMDTPERREVIDFSVPYAEMETVMIVSAEAGQIQPEATGFWAEFKDNFHKTFIREHRWKLILSGLAVTLEISLLAGLFGTLAGFLLCLCLRSKLKILSDISKLFCTLMQGIPSLVVLMITNFVIFGHVSVHPVLVGVLAFTAIFAVAVAGILNTGIETIDKGQWEAATALGFGKGQTFVKIILPQAVRSVLPLYKGEFVTMMKLTSIVGYISIEDLTKAGDIIRSRTYEAFFPLIATAIIYFAMSSLIAWLIGRVEVRIDPMHRPRRLPKGIDANRITVVEGTAEPSGQDSREEIIRVEHLKKAYPNVTPLQDVNTVIHKGEVITIIGPSGTGKSTLMRCINRLETPTDGHVTVLGQDMGSKNTDLTKLRRRMGMVFQSFNLFGHLTVIENIILAPTLLRGETRQAAYEKGMKLLRTVGLAEKALSYPGELSGGQKQRVAIARTLAMDPEVVFFDEPTSALDPTMVGEVLAVIRTLAKKGLTMMIVTHEMKFARDVSSRIFYMDQGIIYEDGTPRQIFDDPQKERTRQFVRRLKVMEIQVDSADFDFIGSINRMEEFGRKHMMNQKTIMRMQSVFEELCLQLYNAEQDRSVRMRVVVEYSEESGQATITIRYTGPGFNPITQGDEISAALVKNACSKIDYQQIVQEYGYTNEVSLWLKN